MSLLIVPIWQIICPPASRRWSLDIASDREPDRQQRRTKQGGYKREVVRTLTLRGHKKLRVASMSSGYDISDILCSMKDLFIYNHKKATTQGAVPFFCLGVRHRKLYCACIKKSAHMFCTTDSGSYCVVRNLCLRSRTKENVRNTKYLKFVTWLEVKKGDPGQHALLPPRQTVWLRKIATYKS